MLYYEMFYRRYGVRLPSHLMTPIVTKMENFSFPKNSIHHFTVMDNIVLGPNANDYLYRDIEKKIFVSHVIEITDHKGDPKKVPIPLEPVIKNYHIKNKKFRRTYDISKNPIDENTLAVVNYALLTKSYRYMRNFYTEYNRWWNLQKTVWDQAGTIANTSDRNQFIFLELPQILPSVTRLNQFTDQFNQKLVTLFKDPKAMMILEIWKWLDPDIRHTSILGNIPKEVLNEINIVFVESGNFIILNLGIIDSWIYVERKKNPEEKILLNVMKKSKEEQKVKFTVDRIRRMFLRLMMTLMEYRTVDAVVDNEAIQELEEDQEDEEKTIYEDDLEDEDDETDLNQEKDSRVPITTTEPIIINNDENPQPIKDSSVIQVDEIQNQDNEIKFDELDKDLEQLEILEKEKELEDVLSKDEIEQKDIINAIDHTPVKVDDFYEEKTVDTIIKDTCDNLANNGLMSAAEYRNYIKQLEVMKQLSSPDPKKKLVDYIQIDEKDIQLTEPKKFKDKKNVIDKSMLKSSLEDFDKKYITKTLKKDVLSMPLALQKSGFLISKYEIEEHADILGEYEVHSIKVNPIVGKGNTIKFKLPKINDNGTMTIGGITYKMRKMRTDVPIRKISSNKVALTSYYGKTFVTRSDKTSLDYTHWINTQINKSSIVANGVIKKIYPNNVFEPSIITPRAYSSISTQYKRIDTNEADLYFDVVERTKLFTEEEIKQYEKDNSILIGKFKDGRYVLLDMDNTVYSIKPGKDPEPITTIENFLGLDYKDIPNEYVESKVYGVDIPVGIILGYLYGLEKLIQKLKVIPRRVPLGSRLNLQENEYAIKFSDETLIFNKEDKLASLILGGFNKFDKVLPSYSVYQFDKKDVYLNILESKKITTRYLKEIDLLDVLYVDPITESILKEMNEPTSYRALLIRSTELLLIDAHPRMLDLDYQRIVGYERVAGAIYTEMINAIRDQRSKLGRSNAAIEISPFTIWKRIVSDPSVKITEDINPINALKEVEAVTFTGHGGRTSQSLTRASREYDKNDMGVISESTVDSSDVAINTYTSANPNFKSIRGLTNRVTPDNVETTQLFSTSALLAAGGDMDD